MDNNGIQKPSRQLRRTRDAKMIAGVCSGAAEFLGVDANLVRLGLAVFSIFGGSGIALYALGWLLIPEEGNDTSIAQDVINKNKDNPKVQDAVNKTKDVFAKTTTPKQ